MKVAILCTGLRNTGPLYTAELNKISEFSCNIAINREAICINAFVCLFDWLLKGIAADYGRVANSC